MFASRSIIEHLLRGVVGFAAIALAIALAAAAHPLMLVASALLAIAALIAFRGCPMCWTVGMIETIASRGARRPKCDC